MIEFVHIYGCITTGRLVDGGEGTVQRRGQRRKRGRDGRCATLAWRLAVVLVITILATTLVAFVLIQTSANKVKHF
jgi:hypothetical protein